MLVRLLLCAMADLYHLYVAAGVVETENKCFIFNDTNLKGHIDIYLIMSRHLTYPDGIYQYIFKITLLIHPTHIYTGFYYKMNICGLMGLLLFATSLNYWRDPLVNSTRRTVDMVVAKSSIAYHLWLSLYTYNKLITTLPISVGSCLYFFSFYLNDKKYVKSAALCHCLLHTFVSIGASLTYRDYYLQKNMNVSDENISHFYLNVCTF